MGERSVDEAVYGNRMPVLPYSHCRLWFTLWTRGAPCVSRRVRQGISVRLGGTPSDSSNCGVVLEPAGHPDLVGQGDGSDHDRVQRPSLAAKHVLPIRSHLSVGTLSIGTRAVLELRVGSVATFDDPTGESFVFLSTFLINHSLTATIEVSVDVSSMNGSHTETAQMLHDADFHATGHRGRTTAGDASQRRNSRHQRGNRHNYPPSHVLDGTSPTVSSDPNSQARELAVLANWLIADFTIQ